MTVSESALNFGEAARIAQEWAAAMPRIPVNAQQSRDGRWGVVITLAEGFELWCFTYRAARRMFARWQRIRVVLADAGGHEQKPLGL